MCLLVLVGCNSFGATGAPDRAAPTTSSEPIATATETSTSENASLPPGLTREGVTDPWALANTHAGALAETAYTVEETRELRYANGTLRSHEVETVRVAPNETRYRYDLSVDGTVPQFYGATEGTLRYFANGTAVAREIEYADGDTAYGMEYGPNGDLTAPGDVVHGTPKNTERIGALLGQVEPNVTVYRSTPSVYRLRATNTSVDTLDVDGTTVEEVTVSEFNATVGSDGLVRAYRLTFDGTVDGRRVRGVEYVRYSAIGSTNVSRPPWSDEAVSGGSGPDS